MGTLSVDKILKTSTGAAEFTLPATDGTVGQVWQTDGSGQLSVDTVPTTGIADLAVTNAKMADDAVGVDELSATGTASATTFLRGDNAWQTPAGTGADTSLSNLVIGGADKIVKGWINFDGTGTIAIGDSFNVSSIVDKGTGNYTINWDTDFANANYAVAGISTCTQCVIALETQVVGSIDMYAMLTTNGTATDNDNICIMAIGSQ